VQYQWEAWFPTPECNINGQSGFLHQCNINGQSGFLHQ
jgi:hypothetical protein